MANTSNPFTNMNVPSTSRSRFINNFDSNSAFQHGVNQSIWSAGLDSSSSSSTAKGASTASTFSGDLDRTYSATDLSGSRFVNGPSAVGQVPSLEASPVRQRNAAAPSSMRPTQMPAASILSANAAARLQLNPNAGIFSNQTTSADALPLQAGASSRASSRHRLGSSGPQDSINFFDIYPDGNAQIYSRASSQAVSHSNSQAVSRNSSLPPSRHGMESSPTDASFNLGAFSDLRSTSFVSERPTSGGQLSGISFGQFGLGRNGAGMTVSSSSAVPNPLLAHDGAIDGFSARSGSVGSRSMAAANASRTADQLAALAIQNADEFGQPSQFPLGRDQYLSASIDPGSGFPVLNNELQPRQVNIANSRNPTGYINHVRSGRGFNQALPSQSGSLQYPSNPWSMSANNPALPGFSRVSNVGLHQNQQETYDSSLPPQQMNMLRHGSGRFNQHPSSGGNAARTQVQQNRGQYAQSARPEELLSGHNWTEKTRANGQKYIETNPDCRLRDAIGHVARFCGDQAGSRFLQDKLEVANTDEKETVFQELLPNTIQLCSDPFGNYVIQKFFEHGTQRQKEQLAGKMRGKVRDLSMNMYGCRCIQKAFEHILCDQQAVLVQELRPCLYEVSQDQHGNHVVQKAIERLPREDIDFIIHGYYDRVLEMSNNSFGCRVIQRLLEVEDEEGLRDRLTEELHRNTRELVKNPYGNYVVQHIIDHGRPEDRNRIIEEMLPISNDLIINKFSSNVVEKCIRRGTDEQRDIIIAEIQKPNLPTAKDPNPVSHLRAMMTSNFGNYVIQRMLKTLGPDKWRSFADLVQSELDLMKIEGKTPDKKMQEFQRLLDQGPRSPTSACSDDEAGRKEGRQSRASTTASQYPPPSRPRKASRTASTEDAAGGQATTPPLLTRAHPSPQSSSAPSTSDSTIDIPASHTVQVKDITILPPTKQFVQAT